MTTAATGFRPASLRTRKDLCAYCKDPLPAKRRRSREYCSKSCCNRASEERVEVNGRTRPDGLPPFWPLGLEKDFALLGAVRGSVRSVCDELWGLLRRVDAEELEFRRSVETLRGRLLSQIDPHDLLVSVERFLGDVNKEHAQKLSQLQREKESVERSSEVSAERSRRLENELAQVRAEATKREERWRKREDELRSKEEEGRKREDEFRRREEDFRKKEEDFRKKEEDFREKEEEFRKKEEELNQLLKEVSTDRNSATEKHKLLQAEHEHLRSMHNKLVESVNTIQRKPPSKDPVIDVTEQLSVVDRRLKSIHDWVESRTNVQDQQFQLQQTLIEQFSASVAQKLAQRLVIRVDNAGTTARLERLQEAVMSIWRQTDWLIHHQPTDVLTQHQQSHERAESRWNALVACLGRMERRIERFPSIKPPSSTSVARPPSEKIMPLRKQIADLQREVRRLTPLEQELQDLEDRYGQAQQHISTLESQQSAQVATQDGVGKLMLEKIDLQDQIAQYQKALGEHVTEPLLQNRSPQGMTATVAQLLHEERLHILRSPRAFLEPEPRWVEYGVRLDRSSELGIEDQLNADLKRLRKLYAKLHARYHEE